MREQCRCCCFTTVLWTTVMNWHKQNKKQRSHFFEKFIWKTKCTPMKFALQFQPSVSVTQLQFSIDTMKTTHSNKKNCLHLTSARLKVNNTMLIDKFPFQYRLSLLWQNTKCTLISGFKNPQKNCAHSVYLLPILRKTVINSSRAKLLLDFLTFFFKTTTEYFLQPLYFSFLHFIGAFYR